jgi:hypothetical protein
VAKAKTAILGTPSLLRYPRGVDSQHCDANFHALGIAGKHGDKMILISGSRGSRL